MDPMPVDDQPKPESDSGVPAPADGVTGPADAPAGSADAPAGSTGVSAAAANAPEDAAGGTDEVAASDERVYTAEVRTRANIGAFLILGAVVGAVVAVIWTFLFPDDTYTYGQVLGFLLVFLIPLGAGLLGTIGLLIDAFVSRGRTTVRLDAPDETASGHADH